MEDKPAYIPPEYQDQAWADTFTCQPFAGTFQARREAFFEQVLGNTAPPRGSKRAMFEIARLAAGGEPDETVIQQTLNEYIEGRLDCADFAMQAIIRMLYQYSGGSGEERTEAVFSQGLLSHAKWATLGFKYWPDEPGTDSMCSWTENHQILFSSAAYLVGQLYPDETFTNSGRSGREMMAVHRPRIDRWMEMRFKSGFSEWLSNVYYDEDWAALLNLVDFAQDDELRERARMILDLSLFDMALNSYKGVFGSTHGRSYEENKKWAALEGTSDTAKLLFGAGAFTAYDNMSVVPFALSENYRLPQVLFEIANDREISENYQRMGHRVEDAEKWGLTYQDYESGMVFLSNEAYLHPRTAELIQEMFDAYNWWENDFFKPFKPFRGLLTTLRRMKALPILARIVEKDACRNMRQEANITTYRTPDYMLSTAQDYRPGYGGDQQHIWQATLGPDAVCFTTHPVRSPEGTPDYWSGSGTLPRAAQVKNVVMAVYKISSAPGLYVSNNLFYTHAWLPREQFDETIERQGWIFARKGDGYLALRSQCPYQWVEDSEVIADGKRNIWICEMGRWAEDGSFDAFIEKICRAELAFKGLSLRYHSPSQGWLEFGWDGPLVKSGQVIRLEDYPRYDNPYCQANFWSEEITVQHGDHWLKLDWKQRTREASGFVA